MNSWRYHGHLPKFPAKRPERPEDPQVLDLPEFSEDGEGLELDLMRRIYVNLRLECTELESLITHIRSTNAPFTGKDLTRLDAAVDLMKVGFKVMKRVIRHERKWSKMGSLEHD